MLIVMKNEIFRKKSPVLNIKYLCDKEEIKKRGEKQGIFKLNEKFKFATDNLKLILKQSVRYKNFIKHHIEQKGIR